MLWFSWVSSIPWPIYSRHRFMHCQHKAQCSFQNWSYHCSSTSITSLDTQQAPGIHDSTYWWHLHNNNARKSQSMHDSGCVEICLSCPPNSHTPVQKESVKKNLLYIFYQRLPLALWLGREQLIQRSWAVLRQGNPNTVSRNIQATTVVGREHQREKEGLLFLAQDSTKLLALLGAGNWTQNAPHTGGRIFSSTFVDELTEQVHARWIFCILGPYILVFQN